MSPGSVEEGSRFRTTPWSALLRGMTLGLVVLIWGLAAPRYYAVLGRFVGGSAADTGWGENLAERQPGELVVLVPPAEDGGGVLLQGPGNVTSLVNGGSGQFAGQHPDAAHQVWWPWLRAANIGRFHRMIGTVPRADYLGAQRDLLLHGRPTVDRVLLPPVGTLVVRRLRRLARRRDIPVRSLPMRKPFTPVPGVRARVLTPPPVVAVGEPGGHAVYFRYGRRGFLLAGALGGASLRGMVARWGRSLSADVLLLMGPEAVPGGYGRLRRVVEPREVVVLGGGRGSGHRHPGGSRGGAREHRVGGNGGVAVYTDGRELRVSTDVHPGRS